MSRALRACTTVLALLALLGAVPAFAQQAPVVRVPSYWDSKARVEKPNISGLRLIRFATGEGYPPFHYNDADGRPVGFVVDLARAVCVEIGVQCTLQAWRWEALLDTIQKGQADAIIAMVRPNERLWRDFSISERFHQPIARFVARSGGAVPETTPEALSGKTVAVVEGTGHEAYLRTFFPEASLRSFPRAEDARAALKAGIVDLLFGDGVSLALWLNGTTSDKCCHFVGGPFIEPRYFGEGIGILTAKGNEVLSRAIAYGLRRVDEKGVFAEIYLRHFPLGFY